MNVLETVKKVPLRTDCVNGTTKYEANTCVTLPNAYWRSELEFLEPLKLPVLTKPGVSLIGKAMSTKT
jgi:hypothetical protein